MVGPVSHVKLPNKWYISYQLITVDKTFKFHVLCEVLWWGN